MAEKRVDAEIDRLYGLPLDEFTSARDALARTLRADGHKDEAAEVAALRKPVHAAWVVNRLTRTRRSAVQELVRAADAVRAGRDGAGERFRGALDELTVAAREVLREEGREASDAVLRDVATTFRTGAAADPEALRAGRLTQPLEATGFEGMAGAVLPPPPNRSDDRRPPARPDRERAETAKRELATARDEAKRLRRAADAAEREARRLAADADRAERAVEAAEKRLQRARR